MYFAGTELVDVKTGKRAGILKLIGTTGVIELTVSCLITMLLAGSSEFSATDFYCILALNWVPALLGADCRTLVERALGVIVVYKDDSNEEIKW